MKAKYYILIVATILLGTACNPLEDTSLREKFENPGTPISQEELDAAISVTQLPNSESSVIGDQYVVLKNSRPDIGGVWHCATTTGDKIIKSNQDTIIYGSNGTFEIYFQGLSANQIVTSKSFHVTITNVFDEYDHLLTGANSKVEKDAKKTWKFRDTNLPVAYNGMLGIWYADRSAGKDTSKRTPGEGSWDSNHNAEVADQTMTFEFDGNKLTTYDKTGAVVQTGKWAYTHNESNLILGELITDIPVIGCNTIGIWQSFNGTQTPYWIIEISEDEMLLCLPGTYTDAVYADPGTNYWDFDASYYFLEAVK